MLVQEMLRFTSSRRPNKEAIVQDGKRYSYIEIEEKSNLVAQYLIRSGIKKGDRIGIYSSKCVAEVIIIYGILKAGGIFVHINPHFKDSQLKHVVEDCEIKMLFLHESKLNTLIKVYPQKNPFESIVLLSSSGVTAYGNTIELSFILENREETVRIDSEREECLTRESPAAILYTSGSTGLPKGIVITHGIFEDSTMISAKLLENNENDRLISVTPFCFDGALSQLFTSVYVGGTLVLQSSLFPKDIVNTMIEEKITGFHAVPSFWKMLMQPYSPFMKYKYENLRYISIVGEIFPENDLMKLRNILSETKFYMIYGITEAFRSTCLLPSEFDEKYPSIGKPLDGVEIDIVDEKGNVCSPNEVGEIVHKGVFVSPGYWNNEEKSKQVFKDGVLYTGDMGKKDEDGYLYFIGRKDNMIKSMGYRINPEEIETCIYEIAGVNEVIVSMCSNEKFGSKIKAVISCSKESDITKGTVLNHCKKSLPYYMIPNVIEFREKLQKTENYKINRAQIQ